MCVYLMHKHHFFPVFSRLVKVISSTIENDLQDANGECKPVEKALREERIKLITQKLGKSAEDINLLEAGWLISTLPFVKLISSLNRIFQWCIAMA